MMAALKVKVTLTCRGEEKTYEFQTSDMALVNALAQVAIGLSKPGTGYPVMRVEWCVA